MKRSQHLSSRKTTCTGWFTTGLAIVACGLLVGCPPDSDGDGVGDAVDQCPNTPLCATVNAQGCPSDSDDDGVHDGCDQCEATAPDTMVYSNGCPADVGDAVPSRCPQGPDPRAKEIEYSLVNLTAPGQGRIMVKGTVDNIGTADYLSSPDQQGIQLWEDGLMVAEQSFQDLLVDAQVTIQYERDWTVGGEFIPARYQLIVTYDPDIFDDGNPNNDDCRLENNSLLRSTAGVDSLLE